MGYERGLHEVADGVHAWLLPDGGWGLSNAGLIVGDGQSLLVDTLFDLHLTREMLDAMSPITGTTPIGWLVNTHANGDHCYGNSLVPDVPIVASEAAAAEMVEVPPALMASLVAAVPDVDPLLGNWIDRAFGPYDFEGIELVPPTHTFSVIFTPRVGGREVVLHEVGPAHTAGDVIAHVPDAGVVFTGDILFHRGTPIMWAGPIENWIAACDRIIHLGPTVVVPGHGAVTDLAGVAETRAYLTFVRDEVTARHDAGMDYLDAVHDIDLGEFAGLEAPGRIVVTANAMYRHLDPDRPPVDIFTLFTEMARYEAQHR